jgi:hypothetical protein
LAACAIGCLVAALLVSPAGAPAQGSGDWAGTWSTTYGTMVLTQTGAAVTGTYEYRDGRIAGTVSGNVLSGRWTEAPTRTGSDAGDITFTMSADRLSFNGVWTRDTETTLGRTWTGTRTGLPGPVLGKTVNAATVSGVVLIKLPGGATAAQAKGTGFVPLTTPRQIPVRSVVDTSRGVVSVTSVRDKKGGTQNGTFSQGVFQVLQSRRVGVTDLKLTGSSFRSCRAGKSLAGASKSKRIRRLRADAKGRFRTRGRYSSATVRGTKWDTIDRCDGTLTRVSRGKVAVRDNRRRKTVIVRAGKSYLARAPR